jgi:Replication-relaxation
MRVPAATPAASSGPPRNPRSGRTPGGVAGTNLDPRSSSSPPAAAFPSPSRISSRQLDSISSRLSDEGRATLLFLSEVRIASGVQLVRRLWAARQPSDSRARLARQTLRRLEDWRVIDRLDQRVGGVRGGSSSIIYGVGPAGRRLLARLGFEAKRLRAPGDRYVAHHLAVTELIVRLHEATLAGELELISCQTEPRSWRAFLGLFGARQIVKPDLFLRVGGGGIYEWRWFVEIDLATESVPTITAKAKQYVAHYRSGEEQRHSETYPRVLWTVPNRRRAEQVHEGLAALPNGSEPLFTVWLYDEVIGRLAAEAVE